MNILTSKGNQYFKVKDLRQEYLISQLKTCILRSSRNDNDDQAAVKRK